MFESHQLSFFLGNVFGLTMIVLGLAMLSKVSFCKAIIAKIEPTDPALFSCAMRGLFLGICLVEMHSVWGGARTVITILCWLVLLKSLFWIFMPERYTAHLKQLLTSNRYFYLAAGMLVLGCVLVGVSYLRYIGYQHHMHDHPMGQPVFPEIFTAPRF